MKNKLRILALALCLMLCASCALAVEGDILSIDGKTGKIWVNGDADGYNYVSKYLYDTSFAYTQKEGNLTLAEVIEFLSTGRQEGFDPRVDLYAFINSWIGEKTADIWYPYMIWSGQPMAEGLLDYWADRGLTKVKYPDAEGDAFEGDFYVYYPSDAKESGKEYALVVCFHGGGEPAHQIETFGFCQMAVEEDFIVLGMEKYSAYESIAAMIDAVCAEYPIDKTRVYAVGSSGGGSNALRFSIAYAEKVAACSIMDQPCALANRWWTATEEDVAKIKNLGLPMLFVGGTADMYGLHGVTNVDFFTTSEGAEPQFYSGWDKLMEAYGIEGKELTLEKRLELAENPSNKAEELDGYPFDKAVNLDATGTVGRYLCTMDDNADLALYLVENRVHMPTGGDAEVIWDFLKDYSRD